MDYQPVRFASGLNIMLALWQVLSPFTLGYAGLPLALWNGLLIGVALLGLAALRMLRPAWSLPGWIILLLSAWLAVSPFVLRFMNDVPASANDITVGIAVMFFSLVGLLLGPGEASA